MRPITDASCSTCFAGLGSRSMRAINTPCSVSGMEMSATRCVDRQRPLVSSYTMTPLSMRERTISSAKSGLPSASPRMRPLSCCEMPSANRRLSTRAALSLSDRGSSRKSV